VYTDISSIPLNLGMYGANNTSKTVGSTKQNFQKINNYSEQNVKVNSSEDILKEVYDRLTMLKYQDLKTQIENTTRWIREIKSRDNIDPKDRQEILNLLVNYKIGLHPDKRNDPIGPMLEGYLTRLNRSNSELIG
jgi:hypothetical protein